MTPMAQRAPASPVTGTPWTGAPWAGAAIIASCSAEPFAVASTTFDCQFDLAADRWPERRAISTATAMMTMAASTIHSHSSDEPDPPAAAVEAAAGFSGAWPVAGASALGAGGAMLALRLGIAVRLGDRLEIAVLMAPPTGPLPPHPAARDPITRATAATASPFSAASSRSSDRPAHAVCRRPSGRPRARTRPHACYWRAAESSPVLAGPGQPGLHASVSKTRSAGMPAPITPPAKALQPISPVSSCQPPLSGFSNITCSAFAAGTSKRQPPADALRLMWLMPRPVPHRRQRGEAELTDVPLIVVAVTRRCRRASSPDRLPSRPAAGAPPKPTCPAWRVR